MPVTTEDFVGVQDHIGRYCWAVDSGDGDAWVALWTEDGTFTGIAPEPVVGRDALKHIPVAAFNDYDGTMCHLAGNIYCDYGDDTDTVVAHLYNYVTSWMPAKGGQHFVMAKCVMTLVRNGNGWLLKRNDAQLLAGA
jgi:hypothetical protein